MRRALILGAGLGAIYAAVVLVLRHLLRGRPRTFGWFGYSPMHRLNADYLAPRHVVTGWAAIAIVTGVLIAANIAAAVAWAVIRRRGTPAE